MKKDSTKYNTIEDFPFAGIILSSGTPDESQRSLNKNAFKFKNIFNCECSYKEAFEKEYVVRPTINLVKCSRDTDLPSALLAVFNREVNISKKNNFPVTMLHCASSIDEIYDLSNSNEIKKRIKKEFHLINLHSKKDVIENNETKTIVPTIDNEEVSEDTVKEYIDSLENFPNKFNDNLPVIIQQVDKISEGVNVKPINSVILSTKTSKRATQQIGRAIRLFNYKNMTKLRDSQANVYVTFDNVNNVKDLFENLERENTLTADCFNWGEMIEISNGSGLEEDKDSIPELNTFNWNKISEIEIEQLTNDSKVVEIKRDNNLKRTILDLCSIENTEDDADGNGIPDDLDELLDMFENSHAKTSSVKNTSKTRKSKKSSNKKDTSSKKSSNKKDTSNEKPETIFEKEVEERTTKQEKIERLWYYIYETAHQNDVNHYVFERTSFEEFINMLDFSNFIKDEVKHEQLKKTIIKYFKKELLK